MKTSVYVSLEMQGGTNRLVEALVLRGFPVQVKNDFISLRNGSNRDYEELKGFLDKLNIPVFWNENQFQLLVNRLPLQKVREIVRYKGRNYQFHAQGYHFKWRTFANRRYGIRTNTTELCPYTAIMVRALNEAGIVTLSGCNGHGHHSPNFQLSGVYYGIWFSLIQKRYLNDLSLNYTWKVRLGQGFSPSKVYACKSSNQQWDMIKVLADCEKMALTLTSHASDIRELKQNCFKRGMKETAESLKSDGQFNKLSGWMKNKIDAVQ
ncbi:hypothetical protein QGM71_20780 [Virgibacillus sp. C22-A2]|uniref:Uncharacterized protein n=1 Tax=Virgibacillus tibetensis TaxID=3042313 RepID=A0ABU6KKS5_9BACI|nr:hypothetical protein [Virgibacillus sp. C22-A2]